MATFLFLLLLIFVNTYASNWTLVAQNACFSATTFLTNYTFNSPRSGNVTAVKLVHKSGNVGCLQNMNMGKWGCRNSFPLVQLVTHNGSVVHTVLPTNTTQNVTEIVTFWNHDYDNESWYSISPWCENGDGCSIWRYQMSGESVSDTELVWIDPLLNLYVSIHDNFSLQYGEGCCQVTTHDNNGTTCAEVYFQFESVISPSNATSEEPTAVPLSSQDPTIEPTVDPISDKAVDPAINPIVSPTTGPDPTVNVTEFDVAAAKCDVGERLDFHWNSMYCCHCDMYLYN